MPAYSGLTADERRLADEVMDLLVDFVVAERPEMSRNESELECLSRISQLIQDVVPPEYRALLELRSAEILSAPIDQAESLRRRPLPN